MPSISSSVASRLCRAWLLCVWLLLAGITAVAQQQEAPKVSLVAAQRFKAVQEALQKKDYPLALAKLKELEALQGKTAYDEHLMQEMRGYVYIRTKDYTRAAKALEAGLNSGYLPEMEIPGRVKSLAQIHYQLGNYARAVEFGNRAIREGYANKDLQALVTEAAELSAP